jgi:hypothetical protein
MNTQTASLTLRTSDLTENSQVGTINTNITSFSWNNLNLRILLGTMYEKFDLFNLVLKTVSAGVPTTAISAGIYNLNVVLYCSGLPFINQTYDIIEGVTDYATLGTFQFDGALKTPITYSNQTYFDNRAVTFSKNQEQCNLSIFYKVVQTNLDPACELGEFPDMVFMFEITGIPKEEGNKNGTRMF